ncbi:aldehyde reductase [Microsporum canis CBS 113480]|uniref:D-xylose reductase [NAD(P)H] n=1 Tax=Arthroderma otae (strain ATCC MYA-4605 / CBS 113480) TaxID=554155 RepID=C5FU49_ARTOC|nr:aldehyde reductase [Microsporum canis CBS 113480]EEQ33433.1 aldehyde reductase [Microsporum canis CBS 113480]
MPPRDTKFKLNTGAEIPAIGFGTWQDEEAQEKAVLAALQAGYRHIDTAAIYGTEAAVGKAIKKSGVPREEIFITSKLWNNKHKPEDVEKAIDASLKNLGIDHLDLFLMHWPVAFAPGDEPFPKDGAGKMKTADIDYVDTYKAMEKLVHAGKTKAIGISNFSKAETERLLQNTTIVPAVHQLELHPWLQQPSFVAYLKAKGIHVTQYSSLGNQNETYQQDGKLLEAPVLTAIGKKYNKTPPQVALSNLSAWGINEGHSVLVKSKTEERIKANFESDFELEAEDVQLLHEMDRKRRFNNSSEAFNYKFFSDLD